MPVNEEIYLAYKSLPPTYCPTQTLAILLSCASSSGVAARVPIESDSIVPSAVNSMLRVTGIWFARTFRLKPASTSFSVGKRISSSTSACVQPTIQSKTKQPNRRIQCLFLISLICFIISCFILLSFYIHNY